MQSAHNSLEELKKIFKTELEYDFDSAEYLSLLHESNLATYTTYARNVLLLKPTSIEDLVFILVIIKKQNILNHQNNLNVKHHINVVSSMKNYGYGCADPSLDGAILIYLKNMKIAHDLPANQPVWEGDYGKELGIIKVGPGVTQQHLFVFLSCEKSDYVMDATGSSIEASILSNYTQRGFGHTKAGNHFEQVVGMEILKMDGELVKLGHAAFETSNNSGVHKNGVGPVLQGLFSQSNFAIVTSLSIQLVPSSRFVIPFFIKLKSDSDFAEAAIRLRALKKNRTLESQMHCVNDIKNIQASMQFPVIDNDGYGCLKDEIIESVSRDNGYAKWTVSGAIYADSFLEMIDKILKLRSSLSGISTKKIFLSKSMVSFIAFSVNSILFKSFFSSFCVLMNKQITVISELINLKKGKPTNYFLKSTYWRMRNTNGHDASSDLRKDGVGLIWLAPIAALTKENVLKLIKITYEGQKDFSFEPAISMTLLDESAVDCVVSIIFDKNIEEESRRAVECHDFLLKKYIEAGFIPYRLSSRALDQELYLSSTYKKLLKELKFALDPDEIFSPTKLF
jgi:4-cresol dehydrogenase (hydroxylating)